MQEWARELAELRGHLARRADESQRAFNRWRHQADEQASEADSALAAIPFDRVAVPADAPPSYREVVDKMETGELDWQTVMAGATEDEGARAMSVWMDRRLQQIEQTGRLVQKGLSYEEACAQAAGGQAER